jgi:4-alpha-glucanotransferase
VRVIRAGEKVELPGVRLIELEFGGSVPVKDTLPDVVPPGYHIAVAFDGSSSRLIVSPGACFLPPDLRTWGWGVQLYALRSRDSWGMGDLGDLERFGRWSRSIGAGALLLNPLFAPGPFAQQQPSPYFPGTRRFYNPLYLCIEAIPGAHDRALDDVLQAGLSLNDTEVIERNEIFRLKMSALNTLFESRERTDRAFEAFDEELGEALTAFATYMTIAEHHQGPPSTWPREFSHPSSLAVRRFARNNAERIRFHKWVQFLLDEQLADAAHTIGIVHDLPVGVDGGGADAWLWQDAFAPRMKVGAPPDEFNNAGQDWGFAPFDPWKLRAADYEPFIQTLRGGFRHGAGLRIDHVMAMFRLYWIPEGFSPAEGAYVRYPHRELLDIIALESQRAGAYVIGEDLGTVEPQVREEMVARDLLSYKLLWFETQHPSQFPEQSLAAITNHDLPTIAGMWTGEDLDAQQRIGLHPDVESAYALRARVAEILGLDEDAPVDEVIDRAVHALALAPSRLVVMTLDDALAVTERPNMPGTVDERPNWSIPLPKTLEEIESDPRVTEIAETLGKGRT